MINESVHDIDGTGDNYSQVKPDNHLFHLLEVNEVLRLNYSEADIIEFSASGRVRVEVWDHDNNLVKISFLNESSDLTFLDPYQGRGRVVVMSRDSKGIEVFVRAVNLNKEKPWKRNEF
jgi:hypothetical protein